MFYKQQRLISDIQSGSLFLEKSITYDSMRYTFIYLGRACMYQKVSANKAHKKNYVLQFPVLSALKNYVRVYLRFL